MRTASRHAVWFLALQSLAGCLFAAEVPKVSLTVRLSAPLLDPASANLVWLTPDRETLVEEAAWRIVGTAPSAQIDLELDCAALPKTLRIVSPTQASVPLILDSALCAGSRPAKVDVDLLPLAWAVGRCRLPGSGAASGQRLATLRVRRCEKRGSQADASYLLPLRPAGDGEWRAAVPAGCLDLSFEEKGFVRETWYGLELPAKQTTQLEERALRPSASLSGAAVTPDGAPGGPDSYAFLVPPQWVATSFGDLLSGRFPSRRLADQKLGPKGEFEFSDIPPGTYTLIFAAGRTDLAVHLSEGVEVHGGQALRLPAVTLQFGAALDVIVDSASAASTPESRLVVSLVPPGSCLSGSPPVGEVEMAPGVPALFAGLAPGDWQIELFEQSSGATSRLDSQRSTLHPGDQIDVEFRLEGAVFSGRVDSRDDRLEDLFLTFHPESGTDLRSPPQARLSAAGEFTVRLPRSGSYSIQVEAPSDPGRNVLVDNVLFEDTKKTVEIQLPQGSIAGIVVDADDRPVADAIVDATRRSSPSAGEGTVVPHAFRSAKSDANGRFELLGLGKGEWRLAARLEHRQSTEERVSVEREEHLEVRLTLRDNRRIRGRLVRPGGAPVADVRVYLIDASASSLSIDRLATDGEGAFEVDRPEGPEGKSPLRLIVVSEGRFVGAAAWFPGIDEDVEVPLPSGLFVLPTTDSGRELKTADLVLINDAGGIVPLGLLSALEGWGSAGALVTAIGLTEGRWTILEIDEARELDPFLRGQRPGRKVAALLATAAGVQILD